MTSRTYPDRNTVDKYIQGAMQFPVKDESQLVSMVVLHFDIPEYDAYLYIKKYAEKLGHGIIYWNPLRWT